MGVGAPRGCQGSLSVSAGRWGLCAAWEVLSLRWTRSPLHVLSVWLPLLHAQPVTRVTLLPGGGRVLYEASSWAEIEKFLTHRFSGSQVAQEQRQGVWVVGGRHDRGHEALGACPGNLGQRG